MKKIFSVILIFLSFISFSQNDAKLIVQKLVDDYKSDSVEVYFRFDNSDLLKELSVIKSNQDHQILDKYFPDKDSLDTDVMLSIAGAKMYDDSVTVKIEDYSFNYFSNLNLVDKKDNKKLKKLYNSDYIKNRKRRPIIILSYPIISDNKNQALIFESFICGGLCGTGSIIKLEKQNGKWEIVEKIHRWTS